MFLRFHLTVARFRKIKMVDVLLWNMTLEVARTQDSREKKAQQKSNTRQSLVDSYWTGYLGQNASFSDIIAVECGSPFPHVRESGSMCVAFLMVGCPFPLQGNKHLKLRQIGVLNRSEI